MSQSVTAIPEPSPPGQDATNVDPSLWYWITVVGIVMAAMPAVALLPAVLIPNKFPPDHLIRLLSVAVMESDALKPLHALILPAIGAMSVAHRKQIFTQQRFKWLVVLFLVLIGICIVTRTSLSIEKVVSSLEFKEKLGTLKQSVSGTLDSLILYLMILIGLKSSEQ